MNQLLSATNISKSYGDFKALNDVSVEVEKGSIHGLLGPNGAGKTSFIRIIIKLLCPTQDKFSLMEQHLIQIILRILDIYLRNVDCINL